MAAAAPELLTSSPGTRQRAAATLALLWLADPAAALRAAPQLLCAELASPACVAARLALQRAFRLSPAQVYTRLPGVCTACDEPEQLACRLAFLEQQRVPVAVDAEAGCCPGALAAINLQDLCTLSDEQLLSRVALAAGGACGPRGLAAFQAAFAAGPSWRGLQAAAAAESARLQRLLRP